MDAVIACRIDTKSKKWQQIAMTGKWKGHTYGEFTIATEDLQRIVSNFKRLGLDIVVDYEHQTLYGDKAPASGWIRHPDGLRVEGEKLYAKIEWTDEAKKTIKKEQYRYLSPVLVPHATDATSGEDIGCLLHSVALTNTPFFTELPPIAAKSSQQKKENLMTKEQIEALKTENEELKAQNEEHRKVVAKAKVKEAIAAKKLHKEQEEWAQEYALKDPEGFDAYLDAAKPQPDVPADNQYPASNKPDAEPFDMTKM